MYEARTRRIRDRLEQATVGLHSNDGFFSVIASHSLFVGQVGMASKDDLAHVDSPLKYLKPSQVQATTAF